MVKRLSTIVLSALFLLPLAASAQAPNQGALQAEPAVLSWNPAEGFLLASYLGIGKQEGGGSQNFMMCSNGSPICSTENRSHRQTLTVTGNMTKCCADNSYLLDVGCRVATGEGCCMNSFCTGSCSGGECTCTITGWEWECPPEHC